MQSLSESFYIAAALIVSGDEGLWAIVLLSLKVSLSAVIIAGVFGIPAGAALAILRFRGRLAVLVGVNALMGLLINSLNKELSTLQKNEVRLNTIGDINTLPNNAQKTLKEVVNKTKNNKKIVLTLALSYGAREEIVNTIKNISKKVVNKELSIEEIDEKIINNHLYTFNLPDVDLMIRTSGEQRISNFLLWQMAYAELYFTNILWPDFRKEHFYDAIIEYQNRERRFGKTSEQTIQAE